MSGRAWACGLVLLLLSGCTSHNPAFDPGLVDGTAGLDLADPGRDGAVDALLADLESDQQLPSPDSGVAKKPVGIDVLVVVDNSPGMAYAQARLARDVDSLLARLDSLPGGPNYHIGVVTSDMGVGQHNTNNACTAKGDQGRLLIAHKCPRPAGGKAFIERVADTANVPDVDAALSCMLQVGEGGCGFEQPLEAMREALLVANPGFVRPEAALMVIVLGNEDDCSAADQQLYDPYADDLGPYASYRCFQFGVLCDGQQPPTHPALLSNCAPGQQWLHPVKARYVDPLLQLKPPGWVAVLAITGPPDEPIRVVAAESPKGSYWRLSPSCQTSTGSADPAPRLASWASSFGSMGGAHSICATSYRDGLAQLAGRSSLAF